MINIRMGEPADYPQLAEMKWLHCAEDDVDYGESNLNGVDKAEFVEEFVSFLRSHEAYKIFVAEENGIIASAMFVHMVPKLPKPNGNSKYIAYLTNVFTLQQYRSKGIGSELLSCIKNYLKEQKCELIFAWPGDNSVNWYRRNGFSDVNEIFECGLNDE